MRAKRRYSIWKEIVGKTGGRVERNKGEIEDERERERERDREREKEGGGEGRKREHYRKTK